MAAQAPSRSRHRNAETKLWKSGDAGIEIAVDVLKGNRIEKYSVRSIERDRYLRPKPVY